MNEFKVLTGSETELLSQLPKLADDGWEVVGFTANPPLSYSVLLKRKVKKTSVTR